MTPLCIYHGACADGFGAAWAVWKKFPLWKFHPGVYQDAPPDVSGRIVVLVDFSYKQPVLEEMAKRAQSILILDHHKSAQEDLAEYPEPPEDLPNHKGWLPNAGIYARFDMEKSGAMLAWEHFHEGEAPTLIQHIQDRDLWKFEMKGTRAIQAALFSYPQDFEVWDDLMDPQAIPQLRMEGATLERKHNKDVESLVKLCRRRMSVGGYEVWGASLPHMFSSDAGHMLADGHPFSVTYYDIEDGRVFSLRSSDAGVDVQEIAKSYGGGGHRNAAGFKLPFSELAEDGSPKHTP